MSSAGPPAAAVPPAPAPSRYASGSSLRALVYLASHQIATRLLTFILNILVARHIGPAAYGVSAVHLYLLNTVILFLTREAIRRAAIRYANHATDTTSSTHTYERRVLLNLSWFSVFASIPLCALVRSIFLLSVAQPAFRSEDETTSATIATEYAQCVTIYTIASFIELCSEPLYVLFQKHQRVRTRVLIDGVAVLARCIATFGWMKYGTHTLSGLHAFAYGQMAFAVVVVCGYYAFSILEMINARRSKKADAAQPHETYIFTQPRDLFPQRLPVDTDSSWPARYTDPVLLRLTTQLTYQSLEKFALTEGEKLVLVSLNSNLDAQGIYGLIQNLGSLVARMVLQPLEESAFMEFSLLFAEETTRKEKEDANKEKATSHNETASQVNGFDATSSAVDSSVDSSSWSSGARILGVLLHFVLLIGLLLLSFGPAYSYVFIDLLYGPKWSSTSAPSMLSLYCVYILFMALNGVTEAFVSAVISTRQLKTYNLCLIVFSAIYIAACAVLLPFGSGGLIAANCVNMAMRIAYSTWFIIGFFTRTHHQTPEVSTVVDAPHPPPAVAHDSDSSLVSQLVSRLLPAVATLIGFASSLLLTNASFIALGIEGSHSLARFAIHVGVGIGCIGAIGITIYKRERLFLSELKGIARKKKA